MLHEHWNEDSPSWNIILISHHTSIIFIIFDVLQKGKGNITSCSHDGQFLRLVKFRESDTDEPPTVNRRRNPP